MINKYLKKSGYKETAKNDLLDKQFALVSANYEISDYSVVGQIKVDYIEIYNLFLTNFDAFDFKTKIESILTMALNDGVDVFGGFTASVERQENGYLLTLEFTMKGK